MLTREMLTVAAEAAEVYPPGFGFEAYSSCGKP